MELLISLGIIGALVGLVLTVGAASADEDVPDPELHPKGVLIDVKAIAIEGGDVLNRAGGDLVRKPHIVGGSVRPCADHGAGVARAYTVDRLARRGIDGLAIDKHLVAGFNTESRITGIGCDEIGQQ